MTITISHTEIHIYPLIRVSTEKQDDQGESLKVQEDQYKRDMNVLEATVPTDWKKYCGQEHATPDFERKKLDAFLRDSARFPFKAGIWVSDTSRWSRFVRKSEEDLDTLERQGIRFFVRTMEYDLKDPWHRMMLGMSGVHNQFSWKQQMQKCMDSKIRRTMNGQPSVGGQRPYARDKDKKTGKWIISDPDKAEGIRLAAKGYLAGEGLPKLAKGLRMAASTLWDILMNKSGDKWPVKFKGCETIWIDIPPLLDEKTRKAVLAKAAANKTYTHGHLKHKYLLSRMILCGQCGRAMTGRAGRTGKRYYRHMGKTDCPGSRGSVNIPAEELEKAVLIQLFSTFGDVKKIEEAMWKAQPDSEELDSLKEEAAGIEKQLAQLEWERSNLNAFIRKKAITVEDAKKDMDEIRTKKSLLEGRAESVKAKLGVHLTEEQVKEAARSAYRYASRLALMLEITSSKHLWILEEMDYEAKRHLFEHAFAGRDVEGRRFGVYVKKINGEWWYEIRGVVSGLSGCLPMVKEEALGLLCIDADKYGDGPLAILEEGVTRFRPSQQRVLPHPCGDARRRLGVPKAFGTRMSDKASPRKYWFS